MAQPAPVSNSADFSPHRDDVFGRIASRYDLLCDLFSLGIHRLWKRAVARQIAAEPWMVLLDGATGTGDILLRVLAHEAVGGRTIVGSDLSMPMLAIAQSRLRRHAASIRLVQLDAEMMPSIPGSSFDAYSISLAIKICDRPRVLAEAFRILRPGGRLIILEASNIPWKPVQAAYLAYMSLCMPLVGWLATGGDASAYKYLLQGIRNFPTAEDLGKEIAAHGFVGISFRRRSLGIVAIHVAHKPAARA